MSLFGNTFGLTGQDPVGGLVASSFEAVFFNKGFQQIKRMMINVDPILRDSFRIEGEDF